MAFILTVDQTAQVSVDFQDRAGNSVPVDGAPVWASSDETVLQLVVAADGLSATLNTLNDGVAQVSVKADVRIGSDVVTKFGTLDVEVQPGEAQTIVVTAGAPVNKADVPPADPTA